MIKNDLMCVVQNLAKGDNVMHVYFIKQKLMTFDKKNDCSLFVVYVCSFRVECAHCANK